MNVDVKIEHLEKMLQALAEKTGESLGQTGLQVIAEQIKEIGSEYLYKKVYNRIQGVDKESTIRLRDTQLNAVARFLGYQNFKKFIISLTHTIDPQLLSCLGSYYSYVRMNAEKGVVLRSPVRFWEMNEEVWFELKGPGSVFSGKVHIRHGCLFILMAAKEGKAFHHVYKIGNRKSPSVLQGTFSGVSTAFDPIGGRVVLIKTDGTYESLTNKQQEILELKKSKIKAEQKLSNYFREYSNNNVAPNKSSTFDLDDLYTI